MAISVLDPDSHPLHLLLPCVAIRAHSTRRLEANVATKDGQDRLPRQCHAGDHCFLLAGFPDIEDQCGSRVALERFAGLGPARSQCCLWSALCPRREIRRQRTDHAFETTYATNTRIRSMLESVDLCSCVLRRKSHLQVSPIALLIR